MSRVVNGHTISPLWGWHHGPYLITTDTERAAESGIGYFVVARFGWDTPDPATATLTRIGEALDLGDAVTMADHDAQKRRENGS